MCRLAIIVVLLLLFVFCFCNLWRKRDLPTNQDAASEPDSAGSCCQPPHYSRCSSFHQPPPYSEVSVLVYILDWITWRKLTESQMSSCKKTCWNNIASIINNKIDFWIHQTRQWNFTCFSQSCKSILIVLLKQWVFP